MKLPILNTDIQNFINTHINADVSKLLLKGTPFNSIETKAIVEQIEAKKRCKNKLPSWFNTKNIIYPNKLNIEQTSSELTAKYKSNLITGQSIIDLTGGFGVDSYYFSKQIKTVTHCEINVQLSKIVTHNYLQLGINNINTQHIDGISFIKQFNKPFDWVYADPSRRHDSKGKVFFLNDCLPNIPDHIDLLFKYSKNILIKTSPLLDLSVGINELKYTKAIHIVAVNNEVKELLWVLEHDFSNKVLVKTINLKKNKTEAFNFLLDDEKQTQTNYSKPLKYLYEPNSAILKAGGFNSVSNKIAVFKLHQHSHLYTNNKLISFPGRSFEIEFVIPYSKSALKKMNLMQANITIRNFPETVRGIRKKFKIKDGGDTYLFLTTDCENKKIIICCKKRD